MTGPERFDWQSVERALAGGYFVAGFWCDRCGDTNFPLETRECLTCALPADPCSRAFLEGREEPPRAGR